MLTRTRRNDVAMRQELNATRADVCRLAEAAQNMDKRLRSVVLSPGSSPARCPTLNLSSRQVNVGRHKSRRKNATQNVHGDFSAPRARSFEKAVQDVGFPGPQFSMVPETPSVDTVITNPDWTWTTRCTEQLRLLEEENESICLLDPIYEEVTMPLLLMRIALTAAIQATSAAGSLIISKADAAFIGETIDQLLAYSHELSATRLRSHACQSLAALESADSDAAQSLIGASHRTEHRKPWMGAVITPNTSSSASQHRASSHFNNSLLLIQRTQQQTPWGFLHAEVVLFGDSVRSEVICFSFFFAPLGHLSRVGVSVAYISQELSRQVLHSVPRAPPYELSRQVLRSVPRDPWLNLTYPYERSTDSLCPRCYYLKNRPVPVRRNGFKHLAIRRRPSGSYDKAGKLGR